MKPKHILNDPLNAVDECLEGLIWQYPDRLGRLAAPHTNVVLSRTSTSGVALVSGGGSGHEPSHAGWVGQGMLTAAVCGGLFASPSVASILAAIRACASTHKNNNLSSKGVLLIVKNYTGDRLNFGVAASQATSVYGIPTRVVMVADDTALPRSKGITGARGVAGTVLVHKIAGAAAIQGKSLDQVADLATDVAQHMGTLGVALNAVTVPGAKETNDRLLSSTATTNSPDADDCRMEMGMGIHGEAGIRQAPLVTADELARDMIQTIRDYGRLQDDVVVPLFKPGDSLVVLVNNLGGTSPLELSIWARSIARQITGNSYNCKIVRLLVGSYMTSFNMHGASVTILNVTQHPTWLDYIDAETNAPAWTSLDTISVREDANVTLKPIDAGLEDDTRDKTVSAPLPPLNIDDFEATARRMIESASNALVAAEPLLTKYDTIVGDGDCGLTMQRGAQEILQRLDSSSDHKLETSHPAPLFNDLADAVSASMGGTSGILTELLLRHMSSTLLLQSSDDSGITAADLGRAFQAGVDQVQLVGGASVGSRTMVDALVPAAQSLVVNTTTDLQAAATAALEGAQSTAIMTAASAGRSNYLAAETLEGTPDPGAQAVAIVLQGMVTQ